METVLKFRFRTVITCGWGKWKKWEEDYSFPENDIISWDSGEQNSGIIGYKEEYGFEISKNAVNRYKDLTKKYGKANIPEVKVGEGLVKKDGKYYLPHEYTLIFALFNQKYKRGD